MGHLTEPRSQLFNVEVEELNARRSLARWNGVCRLPLELGEAEFLCRIPYKVKQVYIMYDALTRCP